jgi:hypothetical protein
MFPISEQTLPFIDIAQYWSREIYPRASPLELRDTMSKAWWRGELVPANGPSRVNLLRALYAKCTDHIAFAIPGLPEPPISRSLEDGGEVVFRLVRVPLPNALPDTWTDAICAEAFDAIAERWDEKVFSLLVHEVPFIVLTRSEFIQWIEKCGYKRPTFWDTISKEQKSTYETAQHNSLHTPKKSWKAKAGKVLTPSEEVVLKAIAVAFPIGELDHKAKIRNRLIIEHIKGSKVSDRTILRALNKIEFA